MTIALCLTVCFVPPAIWRNNACLLLSMCVSLDVYLMTVFVHIFQCATVHFEKLIQNEKAIETFKDQNAKFHLVNIQIEISQH